MNNEGSKLRPMSKLDQLAETIMKTGFIMSESHHVIQSYVDHKGAHFRELNRVGESQLACPTTGRMFSVNKSILRKRLMSNPHPDLQPKRIHWILP